MFLRQIFIWCLLLIASSRIYCVYLCVKWKKTSISRRSYSELDFPLAVLEFRSVVLLFVYLKFTFWFKVMILGVLRIFLLLVFMCHQRLVTELYHTFSVHYHENHKNTLNYYRCHFNGFKLKTVYEVTLLHCFAAAVWKTLD